MPKPTSFAVWTVGNPNFATRTVEPGAPFKQAGWLPDMMPPSEYMNWLHYNADQWNQWNQRAGGADLIVGDEAIDDYTTLHAAIATATSGQTIRVKKNLTLATTLVIALANLKIVFDPGVTITKGAATTGIQINADGVRLYDGRMAGYTVSGDKAIEVLTGADYAMIHGFRFASGTDTDIEDDSGTASIQGKINE